MLHHWLASQEGFNINWQQVFKTYPNNKQIIFHNATKLKLESKCGENFTNCFFEDLNLI
jgi:hypothetical protein